MSNCSLNSEQQSAVQTKKGRILVLAGAGSGKTRVIVHRIAHLIKEGVSPSNILGLTFTNKAAKEMKERISAMVGREKAKDLFLSTFHSFCMKTLRKEIHHLGYGSNFSLYDEKDLQRLIHQTVKELSSSEDLSLTKISHAIFAAKMKGLKEEELPLLDNEQETLLFHQIYSRLEKILRTYNAVDFDHLLFLTLRLFQQHPEILKNYQQQFLHILIDEYQDTNAIQFQLADLLASHHKQLFVVGDDDQSIYGWRGAEVEHILHFSAEETIKLEQNYRSTPTILEAANRVIEKNQHRHKKQLWSLREKGEKITLFHAPTEMEEAEGVVQRILSLKENYHLQWKEMAILYRSHAQSRNIEIALLQKTWKKGDQWVRGIPYEIWGGVEFTERSEVKDLLCYLRTIANPLDKEALLRIINIPRRGISQQTLEHLHLLEEKENLPLFSLLQQIASGQRSFPSQPRTLKGISHFVQIVEEAQKRFSKKPLSRSFAWLIDAIDYKKAIEEEVKSEQARLWKWENVQECLHALFGFEETEKEVSLQDFIGSLLLHQEKPLSSPSSNAIQLMTFHGAKGLEFSACFLMGLEDHMLPHEKSCKEGEIEEERRLFYVGITRAKDFLTLSMSRSRRRGEKQIPTQPSRFLLDIPKELFHMISWKNL